MFTPVLGDIGHHPQHQLRPAFCPQTQSAFTGHRKWARPCAGLRTEVIFLPRLQAWASSASPIRALLPRKTLLWLPLLWAGSSFPGWPVTTQQPSGQLPVPHSLPLCLVALELPQMPAGPVPTGSLFPPSPAHHQHLHGARSEPPHKDQPCSSLMPGAPHSYPSKTLLHVLPFPWVHCK